VLLIVQKLSQYLFKQLNSIFIDHLEDLGVDGRIILKLIFKKWDGGMDWIDMAQDRDRWRALVSAVMNLRVP
jgi:hypothetical protein